MSKVRRVAYVDICPVCACQKGPTSLFEVCDWCGYPAGKDWETVEIDLDTGVIVRTVIPAQAKAEP